MKKFTTNLNCLVFKLQYELPIPTFEYVYLNKVYILNYKINQQNCNGMKQDIPGKEKKTNCMNLNEFTKIKRIISKEIFLFYTKYFGILIEEINFNKVS